MTWGHAAEAEKMHLLREGISDHLLLVGAAEPSEVLQDEPAEVPATGHRPSVTVHFFAMQMSAGACMHARLHLCADECMQAANKLL